MSASSERTALRLNLLQTLNESQRRAATALEGPVLVVAGPGTGKTLTIVHRIAYLISRGVRPEGILAVTFTNRAAREMRERAEALLGSPRGMFIGTFHSLGIRILAGELSGGFTVYDRQEQVRLIRALLKKSASRPCAKASVTVIAEKISRAKNLFAEPDEKMRGLYEEYQSALRKDSALDFDDLILRPIELLGNTDTLKRYREMFSHIIVDEYQDISPAQYRLLRLLAGRSGNICAVGDPDQAIYAFRGADVEHFLGFERDFEGAETVVLTRNYRSTETVLKASGALIRNNTRRIPGELRPSRERGRPVTVVSVPDERAEGEVIVGEIEKRIGGTSHQRLFRTGEMDGHGGEPCGFSDFAVIFRTNAQVKAMEEAFAASGIPYQVVGRPQRLKRSAAADAISCLSAIADPADGEALRRVASMEQRGLSSEAISEASARAENEGLSLYEAMKACAHRWTGGDRKFLVMMERFLELKNRLSIDALLDVVLEESGLRMVYGDGGSFTPLENLASAYRGLPASEALAGFINDSKILSPADAYDPRVHAVTLMTMHTAKGLEFKVVFIAGVEDGLIPYTLNKDDADIEEERRLFYVGMTRAKDELFLIHARRRFLYGRRLPRQPSPFLDEVPEGLIKRVTVPDRIRREKRDDQMGLF
ncbi:MAG: UvrD-helicase domain-containing protein [Nitrospirae bacterium]|nr:UvrD-helicase domain-containing protein [Nitrospirota bacterium]